MKEEDFISLVYVSTATRLFSPDECMDLLQHSRKRDRKAGVTGMLLYDSGHFMQALEGPAGAVDALHERIQRDERHHSMITLLREPIDERRFPEWAMAFLDVNTATKEEHEAISSFLQLPPGREALAYQPGHAWRLLLSFKQGLRQSGSLHDTPLPASRGQPSS